MKEQHNWKNIMLFALILSSLIVISSCESIFQNSDNNSSSNDLESIPKSITTAQNDFAMDLFKKVNEEETDSNLFISPISAEFALTMTMNGADGKTLDEMSETLDYGDADLKTINSSCNTLIQELQNLKGEVTLNLANSIWYRNSLTLQDDFKSLNQDYFQAKIQGLEFSKQQKSKNTINNWVSEKTEGKIENLISGIDPQSVMFLINAIYFNANWKYTFDKKQTDEGSFTLKNGNTVSCQMMKIKQEYPYYSNDQIQAIELPYANNNYTMTVILPEETSINSYLKDFNQTDLEQIISNFEKDSVNLYFPKLELDYEKKLNKALKALGIQQAFLSDKADFSKMFKEIKVKLWINKVKQKTYLKINEKGTEAAGATVVEMFRTGTGGNEKIYMRLDQPFVFFIREKRTGTMLFSGKIMDPR